MANILLTRQCVRSCPYCFAKQLTENAVPKEYLTYENLIYIADFLSSANEERVSLLGGEPFLHPNCLAIAKYMILRGFSVTIFTSGITSEASLAHIEKELEYFSPDKLDIVVNYNAPESSGIYEQQRIEHFFKTCSTFCSLGVNIYHTNFNFEYAIEAKKQYGLKSGLRVGLAHPVPGKDNSCLPPDKKLMRKMAHNLVTALPLLEQADMKLNMDCGFPLCVFSDEELGKLYRHNPKGLRFYCGSAIDIDLDLRVWNCFPLSEVYSVSLLDYNSYGELLQHFKTLRAKIRNNEGVFEECNACCHRDVCGGGCISHVLNRNKEIAI